MSREKKENRSAPKIMTTLGEFGEWVQEKLFFLDYAPVIFTSAKSGFHLDRLLEAVRYVAAQLQQKIPTAILNRTLHDAVEKRQPVSDAGHRLKFYYATQVRQAPPTFLLFVNRDELFSDPVQKISGGRNAHGVRLRRLSHHVCAQSAAENRRIGAKTQAIEQKSGGPDGRVSGGAARTLFAQAEEKIALKLVRSGRISRQFFNHNSGNSIEFIWEYRSRNFFAKFS